MTLTEKYRPEKFEDMCGQTKIISENGILNNMLKKDRLKSCIFYGPPGSGKTTAAMITAQRANMPFATANATSTTLTEIRNIIKNHTSPMLLYLDEIQYFNKKQQQSLLPYIESGMIVLIASTTDNPYYCCYDALLSRCQVIEFQQVSPDDIMGQLKKIAKQEQHEITNEALYLISQHASGDVRRGINQLELAFIQYDHKIEINDIKKITSSTQLNGFDTDGDIHYALISALQKSIRGSNPDAAVFYLMRLLQGGDILSPCRRLLVIANEDIGLAQPDAIPFVYACCEMAKQLGLPEGAKPLVNAALYMALSPKSSTCERTYMPMLDDIKLNKGSIIPKHMRHACSPGYISPHNYPHHYVKQQYMPDDLINKKYYTPDDNSFEQQAAQYWNKIKQTWNMSWVCTNCNATNRSDGIFCQKCGIKRQGAN